MGEAVAGILWGVEHFVEGVVAAAKGIHDPTLPLKATLKPLPAIDVPLAHHTVSVVNGRAYLFGGRTTSEPSKVTLARSDVHIVILPSSGVESTDYKKIDSSEKSPPVRYGHSAAVIEERIYMFGGNGEDGQPLDEGGRVWVFDTTVNKWSQLNPLANEERPHPRAFCAAVASEHPRPAMRRPGEDIMPQQPPDPETTMPEIPDTDTYGTFIIQGGSNKEGTAFADTWTFDISSRSWRELPGPPPPTTASPSLALVGNRLYSLSSGQTSYLVLTQSAYDDGGGKGELGLAPLGPWQSIPPTSSSPDVSYPAERTGAPLIPVTTGQGRHYLLLLGGESHAGETLEDVWTLQIKPEEMTAASFKDAARQVIKKDTMESHWEQTKYFNTEGVMVQESQPGRGIGTRKGLAASKVTEIDGASVVVFGGIGSDGQPRADGVIVTVEV